jgi:uncharacterized membrane protein
MADGPHAKMTDSQMPNCATTATMTAMDAPITSPENQTPSLDPATQDHKGPKTSERAKKANAHASTVRGRVAHKNNGHKKRSVTEKTTIVMAKLTKESARQAIVQLENQAFVAQEKNSATMANSLVSKSISHKPKSAMAKTTTAMALSTKTTQVVVEAAMHPTPKDSASQVSKHAPTGK